MTSTEADKNYLSVFDAMDNAECESLSHSATAEALFYAS